MFDHCIYFNTQALGRRLERIWSEAFKPFGLTPPQAFMLRAVLAKPGMLQSELADVLSISRSTATRALDGLEARNLIERRATKRDGRESEVYPGPEAMSLQASLNEASGAVTKRLQGQLGEDVFSRFVAQARNISKQAN